MVDTSSFARMGNLHMDLPNRTFLRSGSLFGIYRQVCDDHHLESKELLFLIKGAIDWLWKGPNNESGSIMIPVGVSVISAER